MVYDEFIMQLAQSDREARVESILKNLGKIKLPAAYVFETVETCLEKAMAQEDAKDVKTFIGCAVQVAMKEGYYELAYQICENNRFCADAAEIAVQRAAIAKIAKKERDYHLWTSRAIKAYLETGMEKKAKNLENQLEQK